MHKTGCSGETGLSKYLAHHELASSVIFTIDIISDSTVNLWMANYAHIQGVANCFYGKGCSTAS